MGMLRRLAGLLLLLPGVGCSGAASDAPVDAIHPRYQPDAADFFRVPWPSDHRVQADGTVDLGDFPNADFPMLASIRGAMEGTIKGFSTMPVGYFELDRDPGPAALPAPAATLDPTSPVQLVAVGEEHCGERVPVEMQVSQEELKHLRPGVLEIAPVPGFSLRQAEAYAFVVRRDFGAAVGLVTERPAGWDALLAGTASGPLADALGPLRDCAATGAVDLSAVAIATVFTTQDVLSQARALRDAVNDPTIAAAPVIGGFAKADGYSSEDHVSYTGTYDTPLFQDGVSPYAQEGGLIHFEGGKPVVQRQEQVPMIVVVPNGDGPFPVILWIDGTGWGQWSHVKNSMTKDLLAAGFAVASYMPQFHGERATEGANPELHTYNFSNPLAGRNVLRQQIADTAYFIRVLREAWPKLDGAPALDTSRLVFAGQSQGAQNGALLAAVEPELHAFVLNGLASYLTVTVLERKDATDYEALLKALLGIQGEIDRFYPVLQLLQLGADVVDPHNYAAGWGGWQGKEPGANLFVLNGQTDKTTHPIGMASITIAGDMGVIAPPGWDIDPFDVWQRQPEPLPISGNRTATDGKPHTVATYLDPTEGHYTIYNRPAERARAVDFLVQALGGTPAVKP